MAEGPDDIDRWAQRLAGRGEDGDGSGIRIDADPLRRVIRDDDARATAEGAADRVGLARLLQRLQQEGLLRPDAAGGRMGRNRWLAVAASVILATVTLRLALQRPAADTAPPAESAPAVVPSPVGPPTGPRARGFDAVVKLQAVDPKAYSAELVGELRALGLTPVSSERPERMLIDVEVDGSRLAAFDGWLAERGQRALTPGRYRLIVDRGAADGGR